MNAVSDWLRAQGLGQYADLFERERIDFAVLPRLTEVNLKDLGLPMGDRVKLIAAVQGLTGTPEAAVPISGAPEQTRVGDRSAQPASRSDLTGAEPRSYTPPHLAEKILTSKSALQGERKLVTVLFCDIASSTTLAERVGPEAMHAVLNRFFELALAEVHRYEGTVNQFLGDGFMALFGAPVAHEDHARRAVLSALAIQRAVRERWAEQPAEEDRLVVRMGLNTGPVVVGKIGDNLRMDYTAVGDTTNLAARLQQHADPGSVLISEATNRLVKGYVRLEPLPAMTVKGKSEPVTAFRVVGLGTRRSPLERQEDRPLTPFVGRDREFAALRDTLTEVEAGRGQVVGVVGEAGVGKSRLLYEFRRSLGDRRVTYLEGRCLSYGSAIPYLPLQDVIRDNCGITDSDTAGEVGEKIRAGLEQVGMNPDDGAPYLLQLLGVKEGTERLVQIGPETIKARIFSTLRDLTLRGSRRRPLVVAVEDLHWIDKTSEEYFTEVVEALTDAPVLLLTTYRPGYRPPWIDKSYATQIALRPLTVDDSLRVVRATVERLELSGLATEVIVGKAEGNPFFLEELTRTVLERGEIDPARGVPDTIQGVLMARIDRLPEEAKRVLQTAAVLGRHFSSRLLEAVWGGAGELKRHLAELKRLEFLYERTGAEEAVYVFKHALTQEVAYESLLSARRESLHEAAGRALEALYADRLDEYIDLLAHHYSHTSNTPKALDYLELANQKATKANALLEAKEYFDRAMRLLDSLPDGEDAHRRRIQLLVQQWALFILLLRLDEYSDRLNRFESVAAHLGDSRLLGHFHLCRGICEWWFGDLDNALTSFSNAASLFETVNDLEGIGRAYMQLEWPHLYKGNFDAVLECMNHSLAALSERPNPRVYMWSLAAASWACSWLGRWDRGIEQGLEALRASEEVSDESLASFAGWTISIAYIQKGAIDQALQYARRSFERAPTPGDRAWAQIFLGWASARGNDPGAGVELLAPLVPMFRAVHFGWGEVLSSVLLGEAYLRAGRLDEAARTLREVLPPAGRHGMRFLLAGTHRLLAETVLSGSAVGEDALTIVRSHLEESISLLQPLNAENELALAYAGYGRLRKRQGHTAEARDYLTRALEIFDRLGTLIEPDKVRAELAALPAT